MVKEQSLAILKMLGLSENDQCTLVPCRSIFNGCNVLAIILDVYSDLDWI